MRRLMTIGFYEEKKEAAWIEGQRKRGKGIRHFYVYFFNTGISI